MCVYRWSSTEQSIQNINNLWVWLMCGCFMVVRMKVGSIAFQVKQFYDCVY